MPRNARPDPTDAEITPEMIEAGVAELLSYDSEFESSESAVERIYCAMIMAALSKSYLHR
jgi:hypothetical protein